MVYHRSAWMDMEESTLSFDVEVLASELDNKNRSEMARKHAELRFIDEIIAGLEEYKRKYYNYE